MRRRVMVVPPLALVAVVTALMTATATAAPVASPAADPPGRAGEHRRILDYWTVDRVGRAVPRDVTRDSDGRFRVDPAGGNSVTPSAKGGKGGTGGGKGGGGKGGGGKGGGGKKDDGTANVLGASWTGGGTVQTSTGKVLFTMNGTDYVCSGGVIHDGAADRSIVLTAAHCVYDESNGAFATNWTFIPDYDSRPAPLTADQSFCDDTRLGCWTAFALAAHGGYTSAGGFTLQAARYDWGFAALDEGGKHLTLVEDAAGSQEVSFTGEYPVDPVASAFGYPAARPYTGDDLVYCRGPLTTDPGNDGQTLGLGCKMNGGSSGGPWFTPFDNGTGAGTQMSVNSYRYSGVQAMFGPRFTSDTQATYQAALTATDDTIATPQ